MLYRMSDNEAREELRQIELLKEQDKDKQIAELQELKQKYLEAWIKSDNEVKTLKDKLHRRNLQIADLKKLLQAYDKYIQEANDSNKYQDGWFPVCIAEFKCSLQCGEGLKPL